MGVSAVVKDARKAVLKAVGVQPQEAEQDLLDTLKAEHDEVKGLLEDLQNADTAPQRNALVQQIRQALIPHTKAEEKVLYAAITALKDKDAQVDGHEGYIEHDLAAKTLQKLAAIANAKSSEHKAAAKVLKELIEHHIQEEERNVWGDARKYFSDEDRIAMNRRYRAAQARVKVS
ncbi:MAG TPA: hemerythrin domain-containing protein [Steroidobacteraceae bacterium]|jgi:hemerythrin-like domain-containing protein|nr:hemerythrin domain-containing protein [Steroidobacteraceae bacterium]